MPPHEWHYPISCVRACKGGSANESHCTDKDLSDEDTGSSDEDGDNESIDGDSDDRPVLRVGHPIVCHH